MWIDFRGAGKRKLRRSATAEDIKKRKSRRFRRPSRAFRETGRDLVKTDQLRQLSFDAGIAKSAIEQLIKDCNMNKSEFFSALCQSIIQRPPPKLMRQMKASITPEDNSSEHLWKTVELTPSGSPTFGIHVDTGPLGQFQSLTPDQASLPALPEC